MEAFFLILWIVSIIVCAVICEHKGRTIWKGVVAGFFIGWMGVVLCACLDSRK